MRNRESDTIVEEVRFMTNKELQRIYYGAYFFRETADGWLQPKPANIKKWYNTPTPKYQEPEGDSRL